MPRVLNVRGFDYWESGMDFLRGDDYYDCYVEYQTRMLAEFDKIADEFDFRRIDATRSVHDVFCDLRDGIKEALAGMKTGAHK